MLKIIIIYGRTSKSLWIYRKSSIQLVVSSPFRNVQMLLYCGWRIILETEPSKLNNQDVSKPSVMKLGILQGSALGPVLFMLYFDDIFQSVKVILPTSLILNEDDTTALVKECDCDRAIQTTAVVLTIGYQSGSWWISWKKIMVFHSYIQMFQSQFLDTISDGYSTISMVHTFQLLGVVLDEKLS